MNGTWFSHYRVLLFRLDGTFTLEKECLLDAQKVLDDLIRINEDRSCLKILITGPETWIEHNPEAI